MKSAAKLLFMASLALAGILIIVNSEATQEKKMKLVSVHTYVPIVLDAVAERAWDKAESLEVKLDGLPYEPRNGYGDMKETSVRIKSMYDDEYIYFYLQYADPTQSPARFPWEKQADGCWKQLEDKDSTGHENIYYEDKLGIFWEIKVGDIVPGIEISPFKGPRADIQAKGVWKDGPLTRDSKRALVTTGEKADVQDVQFRDLSQAYYFGLAVFDNTQINHLYHNGSIELNFD